MSGNQPQRFDSKSSSLYSRFTQWIRNFRKQQDEATSAAAHTDAPPRVIFLNQPLPMKYLGNTIHTAKYSVSTFLPLFLFEQFRRYSNCFFLLIAMLQQIPDVSPTGRWTTLTPLLFILTVSAIKEIIEDYKRHCADDETNKRKLQVLSSDQVLGVATWHDIRWDQLQVGDICRVNNNEFFPADLVLLASSEPQGICFIETSNLDGETNLKIRQASRYTAHLTSPAELGDFAATIECEQPNRHLYDFTGLINMPDDIAVPLGLDQLLQRGAMLRNTGWVHGAVVYTGHETKLMKNSTKAPLKRSSVDRQTNMHILMLFIILLVLSLVSAACHDFWANKNKHIHWYIGLADAHNIGFMYNFLTFLILYNNLIPISLQVTAEIVRFIQAKFISWDVHMYHAETDTPAQARTSNLNEELGMVQYVFSDKTGTLTCNVMTFRKCSIAKTIYSYRRPEEMLEETLIYQHLVNHEARDEIREFLVMLAVCHTVIPETKDGEILYHAASPDERALVMGAQQLGFAFEARTPDAVRIRVPFPRGRPHDAPATEDYAILNVIDFTSARKRMSVIVRTPEGEIKVYCKGADSIIFPRLEGGAETAHAEATLQHLEAFAAEGLRTLVFAYRRISEQEYEEWADEYHAASVALTNREEQIDAAAQRVETGLTLLGATAIEDKLQDGVPETIAALKAASIKVWVLTGDKQETAINIAHSARLIRSDTALLLLNSTNLDGTRHALTQLTMELATIKHDEVALVVDGQTLKYAMGCEMVSELLALCTRCKVVICCRTSPIQKAEVVEMVAKATGAVTLAIGDGANDVAMIQRASVGIGISGVEGLQAVCASDYSIAQFRFLLRLLLVHGSWNYLRISKLILYSFYKNICLYIIELWFAIYSAWSGQILFERWTIGFYNVVFTALPPFVIGLFDKICSSETMLRYPILYLPSQQGLLFNVRVFWVWVLNSLLHSALLFWLPMAMADHDALWPGGRDGGFLMLGNMVYTYVVLTVCLKAGLATHSWTCLMHISIWGSLLLWLLFVLIYSNVYPTIKMGAVMRGMDTMLFTSAVFWIGLVLVPLATLVPDFMLTVIHNSAFKSMTEAVRESEIKKRDPAALLDHPRPSLAETARLLHNVRSVFGRRPPRTSAEMELSHGFAFSQEEGASVSQAEVIRAYGTSQPRPRS